MKSQLYTFVEQAKDKGWVNNELWPLYTECFYVEDNKEYPCTIAAITLHLDDEEIEVQYCVEFPEEVMKTLWRNSSDPFQYVDTNKLKRQKFA